MPTRDINIKNLFDSLPHRTYTFEVGEGRFEALVPYGNGSIKGVKRILFQYTERRIIIFSNELRYQNQGFNTKLFGEKGGQIFDELYTAFASYIKTNGCIGSFDFTPYLEKRTKVEIYNPETLILKKLRRYNRSRNTYTASNRFDRRPHQKHYNQIIGNALYAKSNTLA